jgi:hypothetical protein
MENMPMYEPPGFHSVKGLGEPCATPEPSIRTSQTPKALFSALLNTVSRRPSGNWSPLSAIRCPSAALNMQGRGSRCCKRPARRTFAGIGTPPVSKPELQHGFHICETSKRPQSER